MKRGYLACCVMLAPLLAACGTPTPKATGPAQASDPKIVITPANSDVGSYPELGRMIGQTANRTVAVDTEGPSLDSSLWRGMAHSAYSNATATSAARGAFIGSGASPDDLLRPAKRPIDLKTNYTELLYSYLDATDRGGTVERVEFYVDQQGCETDVLTRRGKDGETRIILVDTTGWQDQIAVELNKTPKRTCTR
jgi:hypothetical protein